MFHQRSHSATLSHIVARLVRRWIPALVVAIAVAAPAGAATIVVGAVPSARDGSTGLSSPGHRLRQALVSTANFGAPGAVVPGTSFTFQEVGTASAFTASDLAGVDAFVADFSDLASLSFSATEAQTLHDFVLAGGALFVYADWTSSAANRANVIANTFGVTFISGWTATGTFVAGATPVVSGPFDPNLVGKSWSTGNDPYGTISALGPDAVAFAVDSTSSARGAYIAAGTLVPGSGPVFFWADWADNTFQYSSQSARNANLNAFAALGDLGSIGVPEPAQNALALVGGLLALGLGLARRRPR